MFNQLLTPELRNLISTLDWDSPTFSREKAAVCCAFASLAYENIPEWELKNHKRIKIIPCNAYQEIIKSGGIGNLETTFASTDLGKIFVVNRRYASVVGVVRNDVIFVAIRGTRALYDWVINLNVRKCKIGHEREIFHRGFYKAILACMTEIYEEIRKTRNENPVENDDDRPIVATGHSLGGAMAAIFQRIYEPYEYYHPRYIHHSSVRSCYTYGMPRYGNMNAVQRSSPFHIYNEDDIVPTVPPRSLGFENSINEYRLDGVFIENTSRNENWIFRRWIFSLLSARGIKNHSMELYLDRVNNLINR